MIRIKTQKVLHNLGNIFKMNTFLTIEWYLVSNQKSTVELFLKNS